MMTISTRTTIRLLSAAFSTASFFLRVPRDPCQHKHHVITFQLTFVFSPGPRGPPPAKTPTYFLATDFCFFLRGPEAGRPPKLQVLSLLLTFVFSPGPRGLPPTLTPTCLPDFNFTFSSLAPRPAAHSYSELFS